MAMHIPGNPDDSRFHGSHDYNPNAGYDGSGSAGRVGRYDPHGPDRFRYSPHARYSFRDDHKGDWRRGPDTRHHVGSPGNWGWDRRTHLGNDRHHANAPRNHWGHQPEPRHGGNRGHDGHGHEVNRQPGHDQHGNHNNYGGRVYAHGPSRSHNHR